VRSQQSSGAYLDKKVTKPVGDGLAGPALAGNLCSLEIALFHRKTMQVDKDFVDLLPRHRLFMRVLHRASLGCTTAPEKSLLPEKSFATTTGL
jgi:hypothetical protein